MQCARCSPSPHAMLCKAACSRRCLLPPRASGLPPKAPGKERGASTVVQGCSAGQSRLAASLRCCSGGLRCRHMQRARHVPFSMPCSAQQPPAEGVCSLPEPQACPQKAKGRERGAITVVQGCSAGRSRVAESLRCGFDSYRCQHKRKLHLAAEYLATSFAAFGYASL